MGLGQIPKLQCSTGCWGWGAISFTVGHPDLENDASNNNKKGPNLHKSIGLSLFADLSRPDLAQLNCLNQAYQEKSTAHQMGWKPPKNSCKIPSVQYDQKQNWVLWVQLIFPWRGGSKGPSCSPFCLRVIKTAGRKEERIQRT